MARLAGSGTHYKLAVLDPNGEPTSNTVLVPGVTHILDTAFNKPALQYWTYKQTLIGFERLLKKYGGKVPAHADSIASLLKREGLRPTDSRDAASKGGTRAHDYLELLLGAGKREQKKLLAEGHEDAGLNGVSLWFQHTSPVINKVLSVEQVLVSLTGGYAGTLDACYQTTDGRTVLLDLKTGGVYHTSFLQLAAYKLAWEEQGRQAITDLVILQSPRDGEARYTLHHVDSPGEIEELEHTWRCALELFKKTPKNYKGAKVDTIVAE